MGAGKNIEHTPAIAIFGVFLFFLIISQLVEKLFHKMDHYFIKTKQPGLRHALTKIKEELMLMGFCSVVLIAFEDQILDVCVDLSTFGGIPAGASTKCPCSHAYMQAKYPGWGEDHFSFNTKSAPILNYTGGDLQVGVQESCDVYMLGCDPGHLELCAASKMGFSTSSKASSATTSSASSSSRRMLLEAIQSGGLNGLSRTAVRNLALAAVDTCPDGSFPFIEQAALHQTHVIIFLIAVVHISLGCLVMFAAGKKVKRWAEWERFGDSEDEKAGSLIVPPARSGCASIMCGCKEQFTHSVDPATYIAVRRFYISKKHSQVAPEEFPFHEIVNTHMNQQFSEILGIRWWMWISMGFQLVLEGYGLGYLSLFTFTALGVMIIAGAKLQIVNDVITRKVYQIYECLIDPTASGNNSIADDKLQLMQLSKEEDLLADVEPAFWWNDPTILETMIVFALWQNSVSVTLMLYFADFEVRAGFHTCYWESRDIFGSAIDFAIVIFTILMSALNVVPVYVLLSLSAEHNEKIQRRLSKKNSHGHGEHGDAHGESDAHGGGSAHKESSHKGKKGMGKQTKISPEGGKKDEGEGGEVGGEEGEQLASWGRD